MLDERQTAIARFYALLASIPSLDFLPAWTIDEGIHEQELSDALYEVWPLLVKGVPPSVMQLSEESHPTEGLLALTAPEKEMLYRLHKWARHYIAPLLDGKEVRPELTPAWTLGEDGTVWEVWKIANPADAFLPELLNLLKQWPFPFRKCPACPKVFVPVRRQLYCSPTCTRITVEENRREQRREYQREYQRKRRKHSKKQQAKQ